MTSKKKGKKKYILHSRDNYWKEREREYKPKRSQLQAFVIRHSRKPPFTHQKTHRQSYSLFCCCFLYRYPEKREKNKRDHQQSNLISNRFNFPSASNNVSPSQKEKVKEETTSQREQKCISQESSHIQKKTKKEGIITNIPPVKMQCPYPS